MKTAHPHFPFFAAQAPSSTWTSSGRTCCTSACLHWGESHPAPWPRIPGRLPLSPHPCSSLSGSPLEPEEQLAVGALSPEVSVSFPKGLYLSFLLFWALISLSFRTHHNLARERLSTSPQIKEMYTEAKQDAIILQKLTGGGMSHVGERLGAQLSATV